MKPLGDDAALLTHKTAVDGTCGGQKVPPNSWTASVYVRDGDKWKGAFHAEAAVVDPNTTAAEPAGKKEAPRGDEAAPAGRDPGTDALLAVEKAVWEAWRAQDARTIEDLTARDISFINIFGTYFATKADALKDWTGHGCDVKSVSVTDAAGTMLSPTVGILTFKGAADGTCYGQKVGPIWGTSVYVKDGDVWKWTFGINIPARRGLAGAPSAALAQSLPPGGTTSWEIRGPEEIVTFVLFDPKMPGVSLPAGLRFVSARDAKMPEVQEHLKEHPERADWAFSFVEITRQKAFLIDGRAPRLPENGGIGLWFAPVDPSELSKEISKDVFDSIIAPSLGAVLGLGFWIPDREYVAYMRARGHHAEYGRVTLTKDSKGAFQGEIRLDDLHIRGSATPRGDVREDPESGTQVLFAPGDKVVNVVVIAGSSARNRSCDADWSKKGNHPLARGVFVGPTYMTTYEAPLKGSAYSLRETGKP